MGDNSVKIVFHLCNGIYTVRKEFAPSGSNFFPYREDTFIEGAKHAVKQVKSHKKYLSFSRNGKKSTLCIQFP